jgi:hypothetical protein
MVQVELQTAETLGPDIHISRKMPELSGNISLPTLIIILYVLYSLDIIWS